jgi:hypothetical protein
MFAFVRIKALQLFYELGNVSWRWGIWLADLRPCRACCDRRDHHRRDEDLAGRN